MRVLPFVQAIGTYLVGWQKNLGGGLLASHEEICLKDHIQSSKNSASAENGVKGAFLETLVADMTVPELVMQMHMTFADSIIGPNSTNELYDYTLRFAPDAGIGVIHDWYPQNKTHYNSLQQLTLAKSRLKIPFMQFGECLHGVGSFKQSMFPQSIGLSASFDTDLIHRVGRAIGSEARAIGIHACLSPVLDLGLEPRWGRAQEGWGEDMLLTSKMGVAMSSGLSKNGSWGDRDAVVPVMKHFAAHGSPQGGINAGPAMLRGKRQLMMSMLPPFKAAIDLGGVRGVMMAYNELDDVPAHVNPFLYDTLKEWGFDGFVTADDTGMAELFTKHRVASSPADAIAQWFHAGGMVQYYDFPLKVFLNATVELVKNGTVLRSTLESHVRKILDVKYDLGLFEHPYIAEDIDPVVLTASHEPLVLEAAQKSIVLLENRNKTLPLTPNQDHLLNIALIGPFIDTCNNGDYSRPWGSDCGTWPTLRQAMFEHLAERHPHVNLTSSWGANTWMYNAQYPIPASLLTSKNIPGGLMATYFSDTEFSKAIVSRQEIPNRDWGLYPPSGLSSNNFSAIWEGEVHSPTSFDTHGWIGVATSANVTAKLYIDDKLVVDSKKSLKSTLLPNIMPPDYLAANASQSPPGSAPFTFIPRASHRVRLEVQVWNHEAKVENIQSVNSQVEMFWNLVDLYEPISKAVDTASKADTIILAVGANWNSDGENADRSTLGLSASQIELADAIFALGKPVLLVLFGGRPFAIPEYYSQAAAVIDAFFPGPAGGQAISDVLFGKINPGGRLPMGVPSSVGSLPSFYSYKQSAHVAQYVDSDWYPSYPFGYGLSYTTFSTTQFSAFSTSSNTSFHSGDLINLSVTVTNTGDVAGSYVPQVYLLQRVSTITQPLKQLVAFTKVYLEGGEAQTVSMELDVDRYLPIVDREYEWVLEKGEYTFALLENGGWDADSEINATLVCI